MGSKAKLLLVGSIGDNVETLVKKLTTLQSSKAGPFDACFCVGSAPSSIKDYAMPLPLYLQDCSKLSITSDADRTPSADGILTINKNLYGLGLVQNGTDSQQQTANIWELAIAKTTVVVVSVPPHARTDSQATKPLLEKLAHVSYVGCDLLLSSEFPQGIEQLLLSDVAPGSFDVADIALRARARYHIAPHSVHTQSHPFSHLKSASSTFTPKHVGRFITLAPVVTPAQSKEKGKAGKFIHALGLTPLQHMTTVDLQQTPDNLKACPYTDDSYGTVGGRQTANGNSTLKTAPDNSGSGGLSEAQARRLMAENTSQDYRWTQKRKEAPGNDQDVDETVTTLFVHGLHKDVSGQLQTASGALLQAFHKYHVSKVTRPPSSGSYAFLEFDSHEAAKNCLLETAGEIVVAGVHLKIKWASHAGGGNRDGMGPPNKRKRLMEADAMNSCSLFFRLTSKVQDANIQSQSEELRKLMETTLEKALGDPEITAESEPALQVQRRYVDDTKSYGFLDFASHAAASMCLATITGSTDGGLVSTETGDVSPAVPENLWGIAIHWAPEKSDNKGDAHMMELASGVRFERQHFPADARTDCWFCLASPTCEKHLITSVHNQCYIAMPKGPLHKEGHVLIIPVTHSSQGALSDPGIVGELDELKSSLRKHASDIWGHDLFVFERAIQTKGGYHTHVQCVPVPKDIGVRLEATMMAMAKSNGFQLREVNSDIGLAALADEGYFYAEVPVSTSEFKRFLFKASEGRASVPLQFGREVLASVLDNLDLAHWKACVLGEKEETELAMKFRESFSKYQLQE